MAMKTSLAALALLLAACAASDRNASAREWQRAECNRVIDKADRDRCLDRVERDYGRITRETEPAPRR